MRFFLIILNTIFLLVGNVLFSSIHYLHDHHSNEIHENNECEECIIIANTNNYVSDFQEVNFPTNKTNLFVNEYNSVVKFNFKKKYLSRAPPISK